MKQKNNNELVRIFIGTEVEVSYAKAELEAHGISALIKNAFQSGLAAGFVGGTPSSVDLLVAEQDLPKATEVLKMLNFEK